MSISPVSVVSLERAPAAGPFAAPAQGFAGDGHTAAGSQNLTALSKPVYQALQSAAAFPASANPSYVLPADASNFLRLFSAIQATAVERVYPAPVFSFLA